MSKRVKGEAGLYEAGTPSMAGGDSDALADLRNDFEALQFSHHQLGNTVELLTTQNSLLSVQMTRQAEILQQLLRVLSVHNIRFDDVPLDSFSGGGDSSAVATAAAAAAASGHDPAAALAGSMAPSPMTRSFPHIETLNLDLDLGGIEVYEMEGNGGVAMDYSQQGMMGAFHHAQAGWH